MNDMHLNIEEDFDIRYLSLKPDYDGEAKATLISSKLNQGSRKSVLYIHGFIDHFFHPHMANEFLGHGYDFFALELRKYGHSLLPHQHPNYCRKMEEYFEELEISLDIIKEKCKSTKIILVGHSTGGLLTSYYMNRGNKKNLVDAMVLNSPFLDLNESFPKKQLVPIVAGFISYLFPFAKQDEAISSIYALSLHSEYYGEWDFNLEWKPIKGFPAYFAWVKAITNAQYFLYRHSNISIPILLMYSDKSFKPKTFSTDAHKADTVLDVTHIAERGATLGNKVSKEVIKDGMHDLFLSPAPVRADAFKKMFEWLGQTNI
jgi:alpha-beta hydrolase superfamily lysophospholipase